MIAGTAIKAASVSMAAGSAAAKRISSAESMVASALEVFDTGRGTTLPTRGGAIYCGNHLYRCGASILDLKGLGKELWVACAVTTAFGGCVRTWRSTVPLADALGFATSNAERYAALGAASIQREVTMNGITKYVMVLALITGPIAATADITTLDYQGSLMTGSEFDLASGSSPFSGNFDVSIVLTGSLAAHDLSLVSFDLTLANVGQSIVAPYIPVLGGNNGGMTFQYVAGQQANVGNLQLTTSNGELTGATMSLPFGGYHANTSIVNIGTNGDSYYFVPFPYCGSTSFASLCDGSMSSAIAGLWSVTESTAAPEIDPSSAVSGLTLLIGGLALVRGRRFVPMSRAVG